MFEFIIMMVVCDNKFCVGSDGTIYKFVIIKVGLDGIETIPWIDKFRVRVVRDNIQSQLGK